jgi:hypothetical protein
MAKTIGVLTGAALPLTEKRIQTRHSIRSIAQHAASFFQRQRDRDIERFILERGGVFTDEIQRAIDRNLGIGAQR